MVPPLPCIAALLTERKELELELDSLDAMRQKRDALCEQLRQLRSVKTAERGTRHLKEEMESLEAKRVRLLEAHHRYDKVTSDAISTVQGAQSSRRKQYDEWEARLHSRLDALLRKLQRKA